MADAQPNMQAGVNALSAIPTMQDVAAAHTKADAARQAQTQEFSPQVSAAGNQINQSYEQENAALKAQPQVQTPQDKFKPALNDMSSLGTILMVMGALAGRNTMQPMTAALNNMTGVMTGMKEGNEEQIKQQKEQFDANYKVGMDKYNSFVNERNEIHERYKGDRAQMQEHLQDLYRRMGMSEKEVDRLESNAMDLQKLASAAEEKNAALQARHEDMQLMAQTRQNVADTGAISRERNVDVQVGARTDAQREKDVFTLKNEKTKALAKVKPGTPAYKQISAQFDAAIQEAQQAGGGTPSTSKDPLGLFN